MTPTSCRDPELLHPLLLPVWVRFMRLGRAAGLVLVFTRGFSSSRDQDALYLVGRRGIPGEGIVTKARGGQSWHNVERDGKPAALAFDVCVMTADGKRVLPSSAPEWDTLGRIGESLGLTWGGRFGDNPGTVRIEGWDKGHFQLDEWGSLSLEQAMAGKDPAEGVA